MKLDECANFIMDKCGPALKASGGCYYAESRTYMIQDGECVVLVRANNPAAAKAKALGRLVENRITVHQKGDNRTFIENCGTLNL